MIRLRHTDEWVGLLVILALVLFLGAVLDVGLLRNWFRPTSVLRIVLPASGVSGLATGADVEVLGIRAGVVQRLVIQPNQQMYAEAAIDQQAQAFIRRNSHAVIRRRYGIAGAAYVDISRGSGAPMDWSYAVIQATTERAPTEGVGALIDTVRQKVFPILDDTRHTVASLAAISERTENGQGTVGRLVKDDALARQTETAVASLQQEITKLGGVINELDAAAKDVHAVTAKASAGDASVPEALRRMNSLLASLQTATHGIAQATPHLPQIARNTETATTDLPALLTQTQVTVAELQKLVVQLQGNWLLGGGGAQPPPTRRVPTSDVHP